MTMFLSPMRKRYRALSLLVSISFLLQSLAPYDNAFAAFTQASPFEIPTQDEHNLDISRINLPYRLGEVRGAMDGSLKKTIIHIQDAHCNYSAQRSIAGIIEYLNQNHDIRVVALEGGSGTYDLSPFTKVIEPELREKVADYFMRQGEVSGAEYYAVNHPVSVALIGVEDRDAYLENLDAYRQSLRFREDATRCLNTFGHIIAKLKPKIYSSNLMELERMTEGFRTGKSDFKVYSADLIVVSENLKIDLSSYRNLGTLAVIMKEEQGIDFREANRERNVLIDKLNSHLSKRELEELVLKSLAFKVGDLSQEEYYAYLFRKAYLCGIDFTMLPNLVKFSEYMKKYESLDKTDLFREVSLLEERIFQELSTREDERTLHLLDRNLALMRGMFGIALLKEEWDRYERNREQFDTGHYLGFFKTACPHYGMNFKLDPGLARLDGYRAAMERFYSCSLKRDDAFVRRIGDKFKDEKTDAIILVTGGFHTGNLRAIFRNMGYSYVEIMPKMEKDALESPYFRLLSGGADPITSAVLANGSNIQIASYLSDMNESVLGPQKVDAFRSAVNIVTALLENPEVPIYLSMPNGDVVRFDLKAESVAQRLEGASLDDSIRSQIVPNPETYIVTAAAAAADATGEGKRASMSAGSTKARTLPIAEQEQRGGMLVPTGMVPCFPSPEVMEFLDSDIEPGVAFIYGGEVRRLFLPLREGVTNLWGEPVVESSDVDVFVTDNSLLQNYERRKSLENGIRELFGGREVSIHTLEEWETTFKNGRSSALNVDWATSVLRISSQDALVGDPRAAGELRSGEIGMAPGYEGRLPLSSVFRAIIFIIQHDLKPRDGFIEKMREGADVDLRRISGYTDSQRRKEALAYHIDEFLLRMLTRLDADGLRRALQYLKELGMLKPLSQLGRHLPDPDDEEAFSEFVEDIRAGVNLKDSALMHYRFVKAMEAYAVKKGAALPVIEQTQRPAPEKALAPSPAMEVTPPRPPGLTDRIRGIFGRGRRASPLREARDKNLEQGRRASLTRQALSDADIEANRAAAERAARVLKNYADGGALDAAREFALTQIRESPEIRLIGYHNAGHFNELFDFADVVNAAGLSRYWKSGEGGLRRMRIAVYLHDLGYFDRDGGGDYKIGHETRSIEKMEEFARQQGLPDIERRAIRYMVERTTFAGKFVNPFVPKEEGRRYFDDEVRDENERYADIEKEQYSLPSDPKTREFLRTHFGIEDDNAYITHRATILDAVLGGRVLAVADTFGHYESYPFMVAYLQSEFVRDNDGSQKSTRFEQIGGSAFFVSAIAADWRSKYMLGSDYDGREVPAFASGPLHELLNVSILNRDVVVDGRMRNLVRERRERVALMQDINTAIAVLRDPAKTTGEREEAKKVLVAFVDKGTEPFGAAAEPIYDDETAKALRREIDAFEAEGEGRGIALTVGETTMTLPPAASAKLVAMGAGADTFTATKQAGEGRDAKVFKVKGQDKVVKVTDSAQRDIDFATRILTDEELDQCRDEQGGVDAGKAFDAAVKKLGRFRGDLIADFVVHHEGGRTIIIQNEGTPLSGLAPERARALVPVVESVLREFARYGIVFIVPRGQDPIDYVLRNFGEVDGRVVLFDFMNLACLGDVSRDNAAAVRAGEDVDRLAQALMRDPAVPAPIRMAAAPQALATGEGRRASLTREDAIESLQQTRSYLMQFSDAHGYGWLSDDIRLKAGDIVGRIIGNRMEPILVKMPDGRIVRFDLKGQSENVGDVGEAGAIDFDTQVTPSLLPPAPPPQEETPQAVPAPAEEAKRFPTRRDLINDVRRQYDVQIALQRAGEAPEIESGGYYDYEGTAVRLTEDTSGTAEARHIKLTEMGSHAGVYHTHPWTMGAPTNERPSEDDLNVDLFGLGTPCREHIIFTPTRTIILERRDGFDIFQDPTSLPSMCFDTLSDLIVLYYRTVFPGILESRTYAGSLSLQTLLNMMRDEFVETIGSNNYDVIWREVARLYGYHLTVIRHNPDGSENVEEYDPLQTPPEWRTQFDERVARGELGTAFIDAIVDGTYRMALWEDPAQDQEEDAREWFLDEIAYNSAVLYEAGMPELSDYMNAQGSVLASVIPGAAEMPGIFGAGLPGEGKRASITRGVLTEGDRLANERAAVRAEGVLRNYHDGSILDAAREYVLGEIRSSPEARNIVYHTADHYNELFDAVDRLAGKPASWRSGGTGLRNVRLAVYIHDLGYFERPEDQTMYAQGHEERSQERARAFAGEHPGALSEADIRAIQYMVGKTVMKIVAPFKNDKFDGEVNEENECYEDILEHVSSGDLRKETKIFLRKEFGISDDTAYRAHRDTVLDAIYGGRLLSIADILGHYRTYPHIIANLQPEFRRDGNPVRASTRFEQIGDSVFFLNTVAIDWRLKYILGSTSSAADLDQAKREASEEYMQLAEFREREGRSWSIYKRVNIDTLRESGLWRDRRANVEMLMEVQDAINVLRGRDGKGNKVVASEVERVKARETLENFVRAGIREGTFEKGGEEEAALMREIEGFAAEGAGRALRVRTESGGEIVLPPVTNAEAIRSFGPAPNDTLQGGEKIGDGIDAVVYGTPGSVIKIVETGRAERFGNRMGRMEFDKAVESLDRINGELIARFMVATESGRTVILQERATPLSELPPGEAEMYYPSRDALLRELARYGLVFGVPKGEDSYDYVTRNFGLVGGKGRERLVLLDFMNLEARGDEASGLVEELITELGARIPAQTRMPAPVLPPALAPAPVPSARRASLTVTPESARALAEKAVYYDPHPSDFEPGYLASNEYDWFRMGIERSRADVVVGLNNSIWDIAVRRNAETMVVYDIDNQVIEAQEFLFKPLLLIARSPGHFLSMIAAVPDPDGTFDNIPLEEVFARIDGRLQAYAEGRSDPREREEYRKRIIAAVKSNPSLTKTHADFVGGHLRLVVDRERRRQIIDRVTQSRGQPGLDEIIVRRPEGAFSTAFICAERDDFYSSFKARYDPNVLAEKGAPPDLLHDPYFSFLSSFEAFHRLKGLFEKSGQVLYLVGDVRNQGMFSALSQRLGPGRSVSAFSLSNIADCIAFDTKEGAAALTKQIIGTAMSAAEFGKPCTVYQTGGATGNVHSYEMYAISEPADIEREIGGFGRLGTGAAAPRVVIPKARKAAPALAFTDTQKRSIRESFERYARQKAEEIAGKFKTCHFEDLGKTLRSAPAGTIVYIPDDIPLSGLSVLRGLETPVQIFRLRTRTGWIAVKGNEEDLMSDYQISETIGARSGAVFDIEIRTDPKGGWRALPGTGDIFNAGVAGGARAELIAARDGVTQFDISGLTTDVQTFVRDIGSASLKKRVAAALTNMHTPDELRREGIEGILNRGSLRPADHPFIRDAFEEILKEHGVECRFWTWEDFSEVQVPDIADALGSPNVDTRLEALRLLMDIAEEDPEIASGLEDVFTAYVRDPSSLIQENVLQAFMWRTAFDESLQRRVFKAFTASEFPTATDRDYDIRGTAARQLTALKKRASLTRVPAITISPDGTVTHRNTVDIDTLGSSREEFGSDANILQIFEEAVAATPGFEHDLPLISVHGSLTYMLDDRGRVDWGFVEDIDLGIHVDRDLSDAEKSELYDRILVRYFKMLAAAGVSVDTPEIDSPDLVRRSDWSQRWRIIGVGGKKYDVHLAIVNMNKLFSEEAETLGGYTITSVFFGNRGRLDMALTNLGHDAEAAVRSTARYYRMKIGEYREVAGKPIAWDFAKPKLLKRLYELAFIRGDEEKFKWLLPIFAELEEAIQERKDFDARSQALFDSAFRDALKPGLDIDEESLVAELRARCVVRIPARPGETPAPPAVPARASMTRGLITFDEEDPSKVMCKAGGPTEYPVDKAALLAEVRSSSDELKGLLPHNLHESKPCHLYVLGAIPTDESGKPYDRDQLLPRQTGVKAAAGDFIMKLETGAPFSIYHTMGADRAKTMIAQIPAKAKEAKIGRESVHCAVSQHVLAELERIKASDADLQAIVGEKSVEAFLREHTLLDIIRDVDPSKPQIVYLMPYFKTTLLALARLNLSDRIQKGGTLEECKEAIRLIAVIMCVISNSPTADSRRIAEDMIDAAIAANKEDPLLFFRTFSLTIELPPVERVDLKNIIDSLRAQAEVGRSL